MNKFRFNFDFNATEKNNSKVEQASDNTQKEATEVFFENCAHEHNFDSTNTLEINGISIRYVKSTFAEKKVVSEEKNKALSSAIHQETDLVPDVYEGGFKVWECSIDLAEFLCCEQSSSFKGKTILELGCGAGLPGIFTMKQGADVHFQDYNEEVLTHVTMPSVFLSLSEDEIPHIAQRCRFYSGDWSSFVKLIASHHQQPCYDVILTSETIYNPKSYGKLHDVFSSLLKKDGTIYVAAKTCYFGVGGGMRAFEQEVTKRGIFLTTIIKVLEAGVRREIMKITFKEG